MRALPPLIARLHGRIGWLGSSLLMVPILGWVWLAAREPVFSVFSGAVPRYVFSGKLFTEPFNIVHAGFALDQPTIGKWLFWFTVMTISSLPYVGLVSWLADRTSRTGRLAFGIGVTVLGVLLLCILSWPMAWLIQYVCSMGFTSKRISGLLYVVVGAILVIGFVAFALRNPGRKAPQPIPAPNDGPATQDGNCDEGPPSVKLSPSATYQAHA